MKHYIYYINHIFNYHKLFCAIYLGRLDTDKTISRTNFCTHKINKNLMFLTNQIILFFSQSLYMIDT